MKTLLAFAFLSLAPCAHAAGGLLTTEGNTRMRASTMTCVHATVNENSSAGAVWVSVTGATATLVNANGGHICANFNCTAMATIAGTSQVGILYNGAFIDGASSSIGYGGWTSSAGAVLYGGAWAHCSESGYTGSVAVSPIYKAVTGTTYIGYNGNTACQMCVWEVP